MLEELKRRDYAQHTTRSYIRTVEDFSRRFNCSPDRLGPRHIREYQAELFEKRKLSPSSVAVRLAALRFFYCKTLKKGWSIAEIPYPARKVSRPFGQIWALPPSTNSSMPVTKLESSEARNNPTLATSSGSPMRPIGTVDTICAITSADCRPASGVLIGPGRTMFERIRRFFRSVVQVRTKERMAALLAA